MKKEVFLAIGVALLIVAFIGIGISGKEATYPFLFIVASLPFFIIYFYKGFSQANKEVRADEDITMVRAMSRELSNLETLHKNGMINESDFLSKQEEIKKKYSGSLSSYLSNNQETR